MQTIKRQEKFKGEDLTLLREELQKDGADDWNNSDSNNSDNEDDKSDDKSDNRSLKFH